MRHRSHFDHGTPVAWAAGMVAAQVGCTLDEGVAVMERRALLTSSTLEEVADAVVERRIRFGPSDAANACESN